MEVNPSHKAEKSEEARLRMGMCWKNTGAPPGIPQHRKEHTRDAGTQT